MNRSFNKYKNQKSGETYTYQKWSNSFYTKNNWYSWAYSKRSTNRKPTQAQLAEWEPDSRPPKTDKRLYLGVRKNEFGRPVLSEKDHNKNISRSEGLLNPKNSIPENKKTRKENKKLFEFLSVHHHKENKRFGTEIKNKRTTPLSVRQHHYIDSQNTKNIIKINQITKSKKHKRAIKKR